MLRVVNRFQKVVGFDRSMALSSSALTALIPLAVLAGSLPHIGGDDVADEIVNRYGLTGGGAEAVRQLFASTDDASTSVGILGALFLMLSVLSFTRAMQRLFEQTWELKPLSVRNTLNGLVWIVGLAVYLVVTGWLGAALSGRFGLTAALFQAPLTAVFLVLTGRRLSAKRLVWQDLLPFAVITAVAAGFYSVGAAVYLPHLFSSYATRYGPVGAVFAMISALFGAMLVLVASAALGREVGDELGRIRLGQRPADDEVRRQWHNVVGQMRSRWQSAREQLSPRRDPGGRKRR
ncbi:hypothetical protein AB0M39_19375 [Streptomyces sp. NPDC051907]|uniref:hypothetical protein n=1 Tax=Streptomyces sp. NPDC051907 TaxID=3155284 RepID=UPI003414B89C